MKIIELIITFFQKCTKALKRLVSRRKLNVFITEEIRDLLKAREEEKLKKLLIEGYRATSQKSAEINKEWESATLEKWG